MNMKSIISMVIALALVLGSMGSTIAETESTGLTETTESTESVSLETTNSSLAGSFSAVPMADEKKKDDYQYIMGESRINAATLAAYAFSRNPAPKLDAEVTLEQLAQTYIEEGALEGVRGDIAFCHALLATNNFAYGNDPDLDAKQNNYGALFGQWFNPRGGVRAHIQHLKAYASTDAITQKLIDPRFDYVTRGRAPLWVNLGGNWSDEKDYGDRILNIYEAVARYFDTEYMPKGN